MAISKKDKQYLILSIRIMGDFGATIAIPVVALAMFGKWVDSKFGTSPIFIAVGFALAFIFSSIVIYKKTKKYSTEYSGIDNLK